MTQAGRAPLLTLEPLLEAVREGLEAAGWSLSGLQKTTSHEYEGRWAGESSRSAYLFFHRDDVPESVSVDVFLDETSRGLRGNLALVVDGPPLEDLPDPASLLSSLGSLVEEGLPRGYRRPVTFRLRLPDPDRDPADALSEFRFKLLIPSSALEAGGSAVSALSATTARAFRDLLGRAELRPYLED